MPGSSPALPRWALFALAALWLALLLPGLRVQYAYAWDSAQFARGAERFDIVHHRPHPPGYPLWVLGTRVLTPVAGNPYRAQVLMGLLLTMAALAVFHRLAQRLLGAQAEAATVLLAFAPPVLLYANASLTYSSDLLISSIAGYLALSLWEGETHLTLRLLPLVALLGGLRPSILSFLAPVLAVALFRAYRSRPVRVLAPLLLAGLCWLAWLAPTAVNVGGFARLSELNRVQMTSSLAGTSWFYGAPLRVALSKFIEFGVVATLSLCGFLPLLPLCRRWPEMGRLLFLVLWALPCLIFVALFHFAQAGYLLLALPPLVLLGVLLLPAQMPCGRLVALALPVLLLGSYYPYERHLRPNGTLLPYFLLRSGPRMAWLAEEANRTLAAELARHDPMTLCFTLRRTFESPVSRALTYDFPTYTWAQFDGQGAVFLPPHDAPVTRQAPAGATGALFVGDIGGLPPELRARLPQVRRISGDELFSIWSGPVDAAWLAAPTL